MSLSAATAGLLVGLSLIVAIGPQNAFLLEQGARRRHVGTLVTICIASDVVLIAAGVGGMGAAFGRWRWLLVGLRVAGGGLLAAYALLAARRAVAPAAPASTADARAPTRRAAVAGCLAFTWLNPAVYLDTLVLLGSVAAAHPASRWSFAAGASLGSAAWFTALGFGAGLLAPLLTRPAAVRGLDGFVAGVMALTAVRVLAAV